MLEWGVAIAAGLLILVLTEIDKIIRLIYHRAARQAKEAK